MPSDNFDKTPSHGSATPSLGEFGRIAKILRPLAKDFPGARELRDDVAVLPGSADRDFVVTTDTLVAGIHFIGNEAPSQIAQKALRVNLSDLAGKGARPMCYFLNLALPRGTPDEWVSDFADGLAADQKEFGIHLAGGDSVSTKGPVVVTITAVGTAMGTGDAGHAFHRAGACDGDNVYVTGTIGDGYLGLLAAKGRLSGEAMADHIGDMERRYLYPEARVRFGAALGEVMGGRLRCAMDVSDGLLADAGHIARESGVSLVIECARVPLSQAGSLFVAEAPDRLIDVLNGGDDYEILLTAPAALESDLMTIAGETDTPLARIGYVEAGEGVRLLDRDGGDLPITASGYTHA